MDRKQSLIFKIRFHNPGSPLPDHISIIHERWMFLARMILRIEIEIPHRASTPKPAKIQAGKRVSFVGHLDKINPTHLRTHSRKKRLPLNLFPEFNSTPRE